MKSINPNFAPRLTPSSPYEHAQSAFAASLRNPQQDCAALTAASAANIAFYRINHRYNRVDGLALTYPTLVSLLGDEFFRAMALRFVEQTPARSANLACDGADLADFITQFAPAEPYPYLADCASLDWALHCAHFAADYAPLDLAQLAALMSDADQLAALRFRFHPSLQLLQSSWAIDDIWRMHHGGATPQNWRSAQNVLVWRAAQLGEETKLISDADAAAIAALLAGEPLGAAMSLADDDFDLSAYLSLWLHEALIIAATAD